MKMWRMNCNEVERRINKMNYKIHVSYYREVKSRDIHASTGWHGADWHISNLSIAPAWQLVVVGRKGNGRGEGAISYGQLQWSVGTCDNVLSVFVVSATSLGLLGHPTSLYQISSCGGSWKTVCSGGVSWLFKNSSKPLLTKLRLLMRTYGGTCTATCGHACNNALM